MSIEQIGTVRILVDRVYIDSNGEDVYVSPGTYPVIKEDAAYFWRMTGRPSQVVATRIEKIEPGLLLVHPGGGDYITSPEYVEVDSRRFSLREFRAFINDDPACRDGDGQRLVFHFFMRGTP